MQTADKLDFEVSNFIKHGVFVIIYFLVVTAIGKVLFLSLNEVGGYCNSILLP